MKKTALALAVVTLSVCLGLPVPKAESSPGDATHAVMEMNSGQGSTMDNRSPVAADINDSDEFFQQTLKNGPERDNSQKIEALIKRMTLEEKVGQMTQLTLGMIVTGRDQDIQIDPVKLDKAIGRYGVGSILNVSDQALTPDKWHETIRQIQEAATKKTRLGIPVIYGIDSIHGATYVRGATLLPQETGIAANRHPDVMTRGSGHGAE